MRLSLARLPTVILGPVLVIAVALGALALGYVSAGREAPPAAVLPEAPSPPLRGVVQDAGAEGFTLVVDGRGVSLRLTPSTAVETLRPAAIGVVLPGDWVNAGALPHARTVFALTGLVFLPEGSFSPP